MRRAFIAACLLLTSGCVVGPDYKRPSIPVPSAYHAGPATPDAASIADLPWWELFEDETLRSLIQTALTNNFDLRAAAARVEQARQLAVIAHSDYLPQAGYSTGISEGKNESLGSPAPTGGKRQSSFSAVLGASWEADLWGRIRRSNEAALAQYLQTQQARRGVMLSLASSVATAYFELLELDLRLSIARRNVKALEESLQLFEARLNGGTASRLETARARAAVAITGANIPDLERRIGIQENAIRILLGSAPGTVTRQGTLLDRALPPQIPAGLPSTLLERRPDVLAAESAMKSANAQIGIATAAYFPKLGLTALLGATSSPLNDLISGRAPLWSTAANLAGPIYTGKSLRARKLQTIAAWDETRIKYEQTVFGALRDVSNALIAREKFEAVRGYEADAVKAYQEAVDVAIQRYSAGKSNYFEVLDAQLQLIPAENALAQTELDRRLAIVQLYEALGGGWKLTDAQFTSGKP